PGARRPERPHRPGRPPPARAPRGQQGGGGARPPAPAAGRLPGQRGRGGGVRLPPRGHPDALHRRPGRRLRRRPAGPVGGRRPAPDPRRGDRLRHLHRRPARARRRRGRAAQRRTPAGRRGHAAGHPREHSLKPWTLRRRVTVLLAIVAALLIAAVSVITFASLNARESLDRQVDELSPAQSAVQQTMSAYLNMDNGIRGYALTEDVEFLSPYQQGG